MIYYLKYPYLLASIIPILLFLIWFLWRDFTKHRSDAEKKVYRKERRKIRWFMLFSRTLISALIIIALASPFTLVKDIDEGDQSVRILVDNSDSFNLFNKEIVDQLTKDLNIHIPVSVATIAEETSSPIGDALLNNMLGNDNVLVITDGNSNAGRNLGDMIRFASTLNSTINTLSITPDKTDAVVSIDAPSTTIEDVDTQYFVDVFTTGNPSYKLTVTVDGAIVLQQDGQGDQSFELSDSFQQGFHQITATITLNDFFPQNNIFHSVLEVLPKPKVLYVHEGLSPVRTILNEFYTVDAMIDFPDQFDEYDLLVVDNQRLSFIKQNNDKLAEFIEDGKGLIVVGGDNSFEYAGYEDSLFETLLPVEVGQAERKEGGGVNVILVLDISVSTGEGISGEGSASIVDVEKALAIDLINNLRFDDTVGVIAFNTNSYTVAFPASKVDHGNLTDRIASLTDIGGTVIYRGISAARNMLSSVQGSKNIILISDGNTVMPAQAISEAALAAKDGAKVYAFGIGEGTDEALMQSIAAAGNGIYLHPDQSNTLNVLFGRQRPNITKSKELLIMNANHFITAGTQLNAEISGFNSVVPKPAASLLVATQDSNPVLTVWRYGLGRVAALTTGSQWMNTLTSPGNTQIITKMANWAIGDPNRNKEFAVYASNVRSGENTELVVRSNSKPSLSDLHFSQIDDRTYKALFIPGEPGFYDFFGTTIAVNYPSEYADIGLNPEFTSLIGLTGGKSFEPSDIEGMVNHIKTQSRRVRVKAQFYRWPFVIAAIALLLIEILIRRIRENRANRLNVSK